MRISRVQTAADEIARARLGAGPLAPLPGFLRPADEAAAYDVQAAVHERLIPAFGPRVGYKIACTTAVMQQYLGVPNPCSAGVFARGVHASGVAVDFDGYRRIGVECEIAVRLGADLAGPDLSPAAAGEAVAACMAAIEIVDDRYEDWRSTDTPTLIADDFFAAGCVLGAPVTRPEDMAAVTGITRINGVEVGRGMGADVLGHPLNALAWLASSRAARGTPLRAGEIVLLGSLVETKWLERGDHVTVDVGGLGRVEMTVR